jgi:hypothetical protein
MKPIDNTETSVLNQITTRNNSGDGRIWTYDFLASAQNYATMRFHGVVSETRDLVSSTVVLTRAVAEQKMRPACGLVDTKPGTAVTRTILVAASISR